MLNIEDKRHISICGDGCNMKFKDNSFDVVLNILRLPRGIRFKVVKALTDFWFPWHWRFKDSLFMQRILRRMSPVHFYYLDIKLRDRQMYYEWALLDTHDGTTDFYKHCRKLNQIQRLLEKISATEIIVEIGGNGIEAFCRKANAHNSAVACRC